MLRKLTIISTLIFLFLLQHVSAQEAWTLEQCIKHAFENNIQIKQQELDVKLNESNLFQSKMAALPSLNGSAAHSYSFGLATNYATNEKESQSTQATSFSLSASVPLFNGFQIMNTQKQNRFDLMASSSNIEKVKNSVALSVAAAYLQILYSQELVTSATNQLDLSKMQVDRTSILVKSGSVPEGNLLEMDAQAASDELQLVNNQNQLDLAYINLAQLLEIKNLDGFKIQQPNLDKFEEKLVDLSPAGIFESAQTTMPQILSAGYKVSSAETGLKIAKGGMYPSLYLSAEYGSGAQYYLSDYYIYNSATGLYDKLYVEDSFFKQIKENASKTVYFSLSIPIFNGWQVRSGITNAKISLDNARLNLESEKNTLYKDIQQAYADAIAAQKKYRATQKNLDALKESFRYSEQKFNVGMVTSIDYITAKNKLAQAETDLLQAKYELIFKSKILEFYKGIPLSL